ncbi:3-ketoacyl-CoA thiolase [Lobosporangium transversale]|uniref:3-ketoacyl-CoA thiolase n=1 Tax=Lobosporangium transversale TaxID=64571 RepID=A0A1Y2GH39_9FUNG|nr:3-ketoacyl-CoA thiolase [Lobosporangium transversale]ORZ10649.1 3-ketoacyl-CoA thiolase [Lobosporangium transversale]|eukprot:XP_021879370.1 3-ketoacyl-CoA thiolase [Lobosporangium transversale]
MASIFIVAAKRTPFGAFGGKLKDYTAAELGAFASKAALADVGKEVPVDSVIFGNVCHSDAAGPYLARHVGLRTGLDISIPALTVNRLCGSGFQSIINGAHEILVGDSKIVLTGGSESMSLAPYALRNIRFGGTRFGVDLKLEDTLAASLVDRFPKDCPMGITAENLAKQHNISRQDCDEYALLSQQRWAAANKAGRFNSEIVPVEYKVKKAVESLGHDEHARPTTTIETLAKLPSVFLKEGTVTAGNASGISDGAGAVVVASDQAVKEHGLKPLAKVVSWHVTAVEPSIMGIGPVSAIQGALKKAGLGLKDMDLVEVNEAFAAQYLAVEKVLGLDRNKTNLNGGAIALGHPLGASGSRIIAHLTHELQRTQGKYAIGSACIGGGQGIAIVLERC